LLVSQIAPTQCCLLQKGSLESKLDSSVKNRQHGLVGREERFAATGLGEAGQEGVPKDQREDA
jgi:hypothetical protein